MQHSKLKRISRLVTTRKLLIRLGCSELSARFLSEFSSCPTLGQLADRPLVLFDDGLSIQHMLGLFAAKGLRPRVVHRAASLEVMRSLAANGEGVGIGYTCPPNATSYDGRQLASVRIADRVAVEPILLVWRAGSEPALPLLRIIASLRRRAGCRGRKRTAR